jgi:hypothetical protein
VLLKPLEVSLEGKRVEVFPFVVCHPWIPHPWFLSARGEQERHAWLVSLSAACGVEMPERYVKEISTESNQSFEDSV